MNYLPTVLINKYVRLIYQNQMDGLIDSVKFVEHRLTHDHVNK